MAKEYGVSCEAIRRTPVAAQSQINVRRLERILVEALEEEVMPVMAVLAPPGRFARPGNVFAISSDNGGNHHGDQS